MRIVLCIMVLLVIGITGCSMITPAVRPAGCETSLIYNKISNPAVAGTLIQLANLKAIEENKYKKDEAIAAIKLIKTLLEKEPITFSDFMGVVSSVTEDYFTNYGSELLLIDTMLTGMAIDVPISNCDKGMITSLCNKMLIQIE